MTTRGWGALQRGRPRHAVNLFDKRLALSSMLLAACVALLGVLAIAAPPLRTGDAHQYVALARQVASGGPPWLDAGALEAQSAWLQAQQASSGLPDGAVALRQPSVARNGVQELSHFWVFPLLTTPALRLTDWFGQSPLLAFTLTNLLLLGLALVAAARAFGSMTAMVLLASPLAWFTARAQVEIFMFATLLLAVSFAALGKWLVGAMALALAATQNLPVAVGLPMFWLAAYVTQRDHVVAPRSNASLAVGWLRGAWPLLLIATALALLHPAYYVWRLGVLTPQQLNGGIAPPQIDMGRLLSPVLDPDIGVLWWAPLPVILTGAGVVCWLRGRPPARCSPALLALCGALGLWFLYTFSRTTNVNSGGTVHVSRYALWLLPLLVPFIAMALPPLAAAAPRALPVMLAAVVGAYLAVFQPDQPERYVEHSPQARWLMAHALPLYWPLPEVFVERTAHIDGGPRVSATDPGCSLMYLVPGSELPCPLTPGEAARLATATDRGDAGLWLRRDAAQLPLLLTESSSEVHP